MRTLFGFNCVQALIRNFCSRTLLFCVLDFEIWDEVLYEHPH
jgi:hypothetical protein